MQSSQSKFVRFWRQGEPFVWMTAAAQTLVLIFVLGLSLVILINGMFVFWPTNIREFHLSDQTKLLGEVVEKDEKGPRGSRLLIKVGNRDLRDQDFIWVDENRIQQRYLPDDALVMERQEDGNFYGYLKEIRLKGSGEAFSVDSPGAWGRFQSFLDQVSDKRAALKDQFENLGRISDKIETIRIDLKSANETETQNLVQRQQELKNKFDRELIDLETKQAEVEKRVAHLETVGGIPIEMPLTEIIRVWQPNKMSIFEKMSFYIEKIIELLFDDPRESNTEGGLFPAIIGTVMLVFIMSLIAFPMGVIAGVYLAEYATEGKLIKAVRIAVNNLAGIPSIVYGIFGLGFFVYGVGGTLDQLFFEDSLPQPTFGTGGILWASLTLSVLTLPVVIVATEEALKTVPRILKNGSLALGATQFQTLIKVLIPAAGPGILTGFILAMARAAGEVAPLMLTGVVKLAPALPIDGDFPFFHFDRKFMHLGFHIYDVGFQSPNAEAARPMVFVTTFLLVGVVLVMNMTAMRLRQKLREGLSVKTL